MKITGDTINNFITPLMMAIILFISMSVLISNKAPNQYEQQFNLQMELIKKKNSIIIFL